MSAPRLFTPDGRVTPPPEEGEAQPPWGGPAPAASATDDVCNQRLDERALSKLKWRCRRGLLENDLFIARFFERHESRLTVAQAQALETLMDLADNDLLDLLLRKKEPEPAWGGTEVVELLRLMRTDGAQRLSASRTSI